MRNNPEAWLFSKTLFSDYGMEDEAKYENDGHGYGFGTVGYGVTTQDGDGYGHCMWSRRYVYKSMYTLSYGAFCGDGMGGDDDKLTLLELIAYAD